MPLIPDRDKRRRRQDQAYDRRHDRAAEHFQRKRRRKAEEPVPDEGRREHQNGEDGDFVGPAGFFGQVFVVAQRVLSAGLR